MIACAWVSMAAIVAVIGTVTGKDPVIAAAGILTLMTCLFA